jgi:hypothetical protein
VKPYCDTSFLASLYSLDGFTGQAAAIALQNPPPYAFTGLQSAETSTALHVRQARGQITLAERDASLAIIQADRLSGTLCETSLDWTSLWRAVEGLAQRHAHLFCRTLDLGADTLLSFDQRQRQAAQAENLQVMP